MPQGRFTKVIYWASRGTGSPIGTPFNLPSNGPREGSKFGDQTDLRLTGNPSHKPEKSDCSLIPFYSLNVEFVLCCFIGIIRVWNKPWRCLTLL